MHSVSMLIGSRSFLESVDPDVSGRLYDHRPTMQLQNAVLDRIQFPRWMKNG